MGVNKLINTKLGLGKLKLHKSIDLGYVWYLD